MIMMVYSKKSLPPNISAGSVSTFKKDVFRKKGKNQYYTGEFVLFSTISNRTIPGIVLSETVLSGDPLYLSRI